jgi:hypothetical protein
MEIALYGQATMQVPHSMQYLGSITALPPTMLMVWEGQILTQVPHPWHLLSSIFILMISILYL